MLYSHCDSNKALQLRQNHGVNWTPNAIGVIGAQLIGSHSNPHFGMYRRIYLIIPIKDLTMVLSANPSSPSGAGILTIASTCLEVGIVPSGVGMCPRYSMICLKMCILGGLVLWCF